MVKISLRMIATGLFFFLMGAVAFFHICRSPKRSGIGRLQPGGQTLSGACFCRICELGLVFTSLSGGGEIKQKVILCDA